MMHCKAEHIRHANRMCWEAAKARAEAARRRGHHTSEQYRNAADGRRIEAGQHYWAASTPTHTFSHRCPFDN